MEDLRYLSEAPAPGRGKEQFVENLHPGDGVDDIFFLREVSVRAARDGSKYLALGLGDRSGVVDGRAWGEGGLRLAGALRGGSFARVRGVAASYRGRLQVNVKQVEPVDEGAADPADFLPSSYRDREELAGYLQYFITEVYDPDYRRLLESFFADAGFMDRFCQAPGEARTHHAYLGGLLEHTVSVATLCQHVTVQHPRVNADLLMAAALLHDIGKMDEYECSGAITYSREGRMIGHVLLGQRMIEGRLREFEGFPREKELQLVHAVISHHGELEWGAPKRPQSVEALVLHHTDNLDAKVKGFLEVVEGRGEVSWPEMQNFFRRPLDSPMAADRQS